MGLIADLDFPHVIPSGVGFKKPTITDRGSATRSHVETHAPSGENQTRWELRAAAGHRPAVRTGAGIDHDTPLVVRAAAEGVWEEACAFLGEKLPREWIGLLIEKAETIYARGPRFRRRVRSNGNTGRDWLWAFMRHWMAALIRQHRPRSYKRLPWRYAVGVVKA